MALVKNTQVAPSFEPQDDAVVETLATERAESTIIDQAPVRSAPTPSRLPAVPQAGNLVPVGQKFSGAMKEFEYAISMDDVRSIGLAAPRITMDTGGFSLEGKDVGKSLTIQVLSYNPRWVVTPGIQGDEGKQLVRFSYDGIVIDNDSETVEDYMNTLKLKYKAASVKCYTDLWGIIIEGGDEAQSLIGETVVFQLSPQSAGKFKWMQTNHGVKIARGLAVETDKIQITVERAKIGSDTFGRGVFVPV